MTRRLRRLLDLLGLVVALAAAALVSDVAQARAGVPLAAGVNVDLNVASLIVAGSTALAGVLGYVRLRTERPKIVAEVGKLHEERDKLLEERLRTALQAAWDDVDRAHDEIGKLRKRERELEDRVADLERAMRDAGLELP
jgi:predicted nuclease with TOPRIM domain